MVGIHEKCHTPPQCWSTLSNAPSPQTKQNDLSGSWRWKFLKSLFVLVWTKAPNTPSNSTHYPSNQVEAPAVPQHHPKGCPVSADAKRSSTLVIMTILKGCSIKQTLAMNHAQKLHTLPAQHQSTSPTDAWWRKLFLKAEPKTRGFQGTKRLGRTEKQMKHLSIIANKHGAFCFK